MNRSERLRQQKLDAKAAKIGKSGQIVQTLPEQQGMPIQQALKLAVEHHNAGDLAKAEDIYQGILQTDPNQPTALHLLGVISYQVGKTDIAVDLIMRALAIKPNFAEAHNNLGIAFRKLGKLEEAVASYFKALAINPDFAEAHNNLGNAFKYLGKLEEAVASYHKALAIKPDYADAHNNIGIAFRELGKLEEAVASYLNALAIKPDYADAHNNLGNAFNFLGKLEEAIKSYRCALEANPDLVDASYFIAALTGEKILSSPKKYVENLFDGYAERYDEHLTKSLKYNIPKFLIESVKRIAGNEARFQNAVDLGCGTGLSGNQFRDATEHLTGIDISKKMIEEAEDKGIYDRLIVGDISEILNSIDSMFDLFICSDALVYVGDLCQIFRSVKNRAAASALFAFSVEQTDLDDYVLKITGRFAHSRDYINSLTNEFGFTMKFEKEVMVRIDKEEEVAGNIFILQCARR